ncbi:MAG: CoA pyrophosphatase [Actinomycetota bacterium]
MTDCDPSPNHASSAGASPSGVDDLRQVLDPPSVDPELDDPEHGADKRRAAVAAVFSPGPTDIELLFIQRATKASDPWSGQMAFPGGRAEPADLNSWSTAERETAEELALDLSPATRLGSLSDLDGGRANGRFVWVSAHGYWLPRTDGPAARPALRPNHEVADAVWVPLSTLADASRFIDYDYPPAAATFPGIQLDRDGQVIWGLTLRLLADLFARLDRPFIELPN